MLYAFVLLTHGFCAASVADAYYDRRGYNSYAVFCLKKKIWKNAGCHKRADQFSARVNRHGNARAQGQFFKHTLSSTVFAAIARRSVLINPRLHLAPL